jgi:hypothetical protein
MRLPQKHLKQSFPKNVANKANIQCRQQVVAETAVPPGVFCLNCFLYVISGKDVVFFPQIIEKNGGLKLKII